MAQMPYDFSRPHPASGTLRKILIFCGVSAMLAGGIWLVLPKSGGKPAAPEANAPVTEKLPEESVPENAVPGSAEKTEIAEKTESAVPASGSAAEVTVETASAAPAAAPSPVSVAADPSSVPVQKGVLHPSDPADEEPYQAPDLLEPNGFAENLRAIRELRKNSRTGIAEKRLLALIAETAFSSPEYREAGKLLNDLHAGLPPVGQQPLQTYTVQRGDCLIQLARRHQISAVQLAAVNHLPPDAMLRIGQKLRIPSGDSWSVRVNKRARLLRVFRGGSLYGVYDIGIGRRNLTPEGRFSVREVIDNPPYPKPHVGMVPSGSPANPLGPCWIGLADEQNRKTGYGIHGTADESTVTRNLSSGCIRMRNAEVRILRGLLPVGTPVVIEP